MNSRNEACRAEEASARMYLPSSSEDRKSTRLNSSHANISYAVFCLKKKKGRHLQHPDAHDRHLPYRVHRARARHAHDAPRGALTLESAAMAAPSSTLKIRVVAAKLV